MGLKFAVTVEPSEGLTSMVELAKFGERIKFGEVDQPMKENPGLVCAKSFLS